MTMDRPFVVSVGAHALIGAALVGGHFATLGGWRLPVKAEEPVELTVHQEREEKHILPEETVPEMAVQPPKTVEPGTVPEPAPGQTAVQAKDSPAPMPPALSPHIPVPAQAPEPPAAAEEAPPPPPAKFKRQAAAGRAFLRANPSFKMSQVTWLSCGAEEPLSWMRYWNHKLWVRDLSLADYVGQGFIDEDLHARLRRPAKGESGPGRGVLGERTFDAAVLAEMARFARRDVDLIAGYSEVSPTYWRTIVGAAADKLSAHGGAEALSTANSVVLEYPAAVEAHPLDFKVLRFVADGLVTNVERSRCGNGGAEGEPGRQR